MSRYHLAFKTINVRNSLKRLRPSGRCTFSSQTPSEKQTIVALSGGVDSAVALGLLPRQGYAVTSALHMTNWNAADDDSITTCMEQDWRDAQAVAAHYHVPIQRHSFEREYWHRVFVPYLENLAQRGWMGNPDVDCNIHIKFGALRDYVNQRYGDHTWLATGHYARLWRRPQLGEWIEAHSAVDEDITWLWTWGKNQSIHPDDELPLLVSAVDPAKDQSYFLSGCVARQLARVIFPLGDYYKTRSLASDCSSSPTVRGMAQEWDLPVANKRDSVGICFIGKRKGGFRSFLQNYYEPSQSGSFQLVDVDTSEVVGTVDALTGQAATIGQGTRVSGLPNKYYVVGRKDASTILVCAGTHHPALYSDSIALDADISWVMSEVPSPLFTAGKLRIQCRIRNLQPLGDATLLYNSATEEYTILLDKPFRGITPGQRAALYLHGICLGGATIARAGPSYLETGLSLPSQLHPAGSNDLSVSQKM